MTTNDDDGSQDLKQVKAIQEEQIIAQAEQGSRVGELTEMVSLLADRAGNLAEKVQVIDEKSERDRQVLQNLRRIIRFLTALSLVALLALGGVLWVGTTNRANGQQIRDCIEPTGECAQITQRVNIARTRATAYHAEEQRLISERDLARVRSDEAAANLYQKRLDHVRLHIKEVDDLIVRLRAGEKLDPNASHLSPETSHP